MVEKECTGVSEETLQPVINTLKPGKLDPPYRVHTNYPAGLEETVFFQTALPPQHFYTRLGLVPLTPHARTTSSDY